MALIWRRNWSTRGKFSVSPFGTRRLELTGRVLTSLQCGRQIAQLKEEYEEAKKTLEAEAAKLRQVGMDEILRSGDGNCRASVVGGDSRSTTFLFYSSRMS